MGNKKVIALNTASQVVGKIITSSTTFVISILLAQALGAEGYGDFTKVTTLVAFFYLLSDFGLNTAYLELSDKKEAPFTLIVIRTLLSCLLIVFLLTSLSFLPGSETQGYTPVVKFGIVLFSISILLQSLITTANAFFQKNLRYDLATYSLVTGSLTSLLSVFIFSFLHIEGIIVYIIAFLVGSFTTMVSALFLAKHILPEFSFFYDKTLAKHMVGIAFPLGLTLLCNVVYFHADSIMLTLFRTTKEVGIYGFAYKLFELPLVIPTFFMNAVFPLLLISTKSGDMTTFKRHVRQSAVLLFFTSIFLIVIGYFVSPIIALVNSDFKESILPLRILLLSLPIFFLTSLSMWALIALKKRSQLLIIYFISMIVNITSNYICIPLYGYLASAWITVVSESLVFILSLLVIQKHFQQKKY